MFILAPLDLGEIVMTGGTKHRGPKGRKSSAGGVFGEGQPAPSPPARESGERRKLP